LTLAELESVHPAFAADAPAVFDLSAAMAKRILPGAPGTEAVAQQLANWRTRLG